MKHIIEKHVTTRFNNQTSEKILTDRDFPALISDLEAEWCKAMEWVGMEYMHLVNGKWENMHRTEIKEYTTAELLKIYQNRPNQ